MKKSLSELLRNIEKRFRIKTKKKYDMMAFSLIYWQRGYWSIKVTDDWHKWMRNNIEEPNRLYLSPEEACLGFIKFLDDNKIDIMELQSDE